MQDCARGRPTSSSTGRSLPLPTRWGEASPLSLAGGDIWQPAGLVQVCSRKMDRNVPLGEDLAFLVSMPACRMSPVPGQGRHCLRALPRVSRHMLTSAGDQAAAGVLSFHTEMEQAHKTHTLQCLRERGAPPLPGGPSIFGVGAQGTGTGLFQEKKELGSW